MITNDVIFRANRFPRLISLPTSTIFVSGTSGITAILKYRSVNYICSNHLLQSNNNDCIQLYDFVGD